MAIVKSLSELEGTIKKAINIALETDVSDIVKKNLQEAIHTTVYKSYSPQRYERRGVLRNTAYMNSELVEDGVLSTTTDAPSSPSVVTGEVSDMLGHWVNYGEVSTIFGIGPWVFSRDFIFTTVENLNGNKQHVNALRKGLNKQGIKAI